jgi:hypothetical protein
MNTSSAIFLCLFLGSALANGLDEGEVNDSLSSKDEITKPQLFHEKQTARRDLFAVFLGAEDSITKLCDRPLSLKSDESVKLSNVSLAQIKLVGIINVESSPIAVIRSESGEIATMYERETFATEHAQVSQITQKTMTVVYFQEESDRCASQKQRQFNQ